jgi:glycosyltransferase involved in cell wall biosynthesis
MKRFIRSLKIADLILVGSSYLAEKAKPYNTNIEILPLGLKVSDYKCKKQENEHDKIRLVWIGSKSTLQYLEQIKTVLENIGSRFDNVILRIICDEFFDLQNMKVEKCKWSFDSRAGDLLACDIALAPLPDNPFTRGKCSFKILEYFATGLPIVASPIGTNKDYITENRTGLFATTIPQWIKQITKLIENPELRKQMAHQARIQVDKFDTSVIGQRLISIIKNLNRLVLLPEVGGDLGEIKCSR